MRREKAAFRFVGFSALGIFMFFIQITLNGKRSIPIDHMISFLKAGAKNYYSCILMILSGYAVVTKVVRKTAGEKTADRIFFLQAVLGFVISGAVLMGTGPQNFLTAAESAIQATGNILCAIFLSSVFVPLLVEYGMVDACGVIFRPVMRRLFLTPGSSAVIGVSAFLGNYSMGHVVARQMYDEGKYTEKESVIIALGFSTCSVGLMLNLVNYLGLIDYWTWYVLCIVAVTFLTTAIVSRLFPISRKKESYKGGVKPEMESDAKGKLLCAAWNEGVRRAGQAPGAVKAVRNILKRVFPVICDITGTSIFVITIGILAASGTNVFYDLGFVFLPVLRVVGIPSEELAYAAQAIGSCLLEPVLAGIICDGRMLALQTRWIVAIVPYSAIIFFAGFIPSVRSSKIPCKVWEMLAVWAERTFISIILAALTAAILF